MGREYRTIALNAEEIGAAVTAYLEVRDDTQVSPRNVTSIQIRDEDSFVAEVQFKNPLLNGRKSVLLNEREIVEAIVAFVASKGHPLPRSGRKRISRLDEDIALLIELDWF
jgi:hypothetical protein